MKKHLSALFVERVRPPKEGSVEYFDLGYSGLALRVGHGGAKALRCFIALAASYAESRSAVGLRLAWQQHGTVGGRREKQLPMVKHLSVRARRCRMRCCLSM